MAINGVTNSQINEFFNTGNADVLGIKETVQVASVFIQYNDAKGKAQNEVQRNQIRQNFIQQVLPGLLEKGVKLVTKLFSKKAEAEEDVNNTNKKIEDGKNEVSELLRDNDNKIKELMNKVDATVSEIQALLGTVNTDNKTVAQLAKTLKQKQAEIEEQKKILNETDDKSSPEEKKAALTKIRELADEIDGLCATIAELSDTTIDEQEQLTEKEGAIADNITSAETVINENIQKIGVKITETETEAGKEITVQNAEGKQEIITGEALQAQAAGETTSGFFTFGAGALKGAATEKQALDYIAAGNIHIGGSSVNTTQLATALGKMGADGQTVANELTMVGTKAQNAAVLIGQVNTTLTGVIASIGTWESSDICGAQTALVTAADKFEEEYDKIHSTKLSETSTPWMQNDENRAWTQNIEGEVNAPYASDAKVEFEFDTKVFDLKETA